MQLYHPSNSSAIVSAAQIIDVLDGVKSPFNPLGWRGLRLQRHNVLLPTPDGWLEQHRPKPGDYLVQDTEGRSKIVPETLFLGGYHRASPADDSEHPAWSLRTHAGAAETVMVAICDAARARGHEVLTDGQAHVVAVITAFEKSSSRPNLYTVSYSDGHGETLVFEGKKLGGRAPKLGDLLVRTADGERIVPAEPTGAVMEEGRETTFENLAAEMDECGATGWASRVRELGARVALPMLELKGEFSATDLEAFKKEWTVQSRMPLQVAQSQPVDVVPGLLVITDAPDKVPDGCSIAVITVEGDPWYRYAVTRQWFEDYRPQKGGGFVPQKGSEPLYYPPGSFKPALPTRVTKAALEAMFRSVTYEIRPDGRTTVCEITFKNGFSLRGESSAATVDNFKQHLGEEYAYEKALDAAWGFAGFLLLEDRYREGL